MLKEFNEGDIDYAIECVLDGNNIIDIKNNEIMLRGRIYLT